MQALDVIHRVLRTRVSATIEEHEQIMASFNEVARALEKSSFPAVPTGPLPSDEIPMPGKVSGRSAS